MSLPPAMTVIAIRAPGGPEVLVPQERPMPSPGTGEILVKVAGAGVNRPERHAAPRALPAPARDNRHSRTSKSPARWWRSEPAWSGGTSESASAHS